MRCPDLYIESEVSRCLHCYDANCSKACPKGDVSKGLLSLFLKNERAAANLFSDISCAECETKPCLKSCARARVDKAIDIPFIAEYIGAKGATKQKKQNSLNIDFCGFNCENPFVLASSVISNNYEMCARALKAGWGGVSIKTISVENYPETSPRFDVTGKNGNNFAGFKNLEMLSEKSLEENLAWIKRLKTEFPTKLIIVSIMGRDEQEWEELSRMATQSGADIIECNYSCPQMTTEGMGSDVGTNQELVYRYTAACRRATNLPILAKLTPNITKADTFVEGALRGGADGIAAINTIKSIATVDFSHSSNSGNQGFGAISGYSGRGVKPIALRFVKDISEQCNTISGIGGIYNWRDAADFMLLGSSNIQICTAVMEYGYRIIDDLVEGLENYLDDIGCDSLADIVGSALPHFVNPDELQRGIAIIPKIDLDKCVGCGRCYIACSDGGHQAIEFSKSRLPRILPNCVGCHLCKLVCPTSSID